jgi:hypothetical protein
MGVTMQFRPELAKGLFSGVDTVANWMTLWPPEVFRSIVFDLQETV